MTVLHGAINFIEDQITSFYEKRDYRQTPLKMNFTPNFTKDSLLSPSSVAYSKSGMSMQNSFINSASLNEDITSGILNEEYLFALDAGYNFTDQIEFRDPKIKKSKDLLSHQTNLQDNDLSIELLGNMELKKLSK